jgi:hypothetical protein
LLPHYDYYDLSDSTLGFYAYYSTTAIKLDNETAELVDLDQGLMKLPPFVPNSSVNLEP